MTLEEIKEKNLYKVYDLDRGPVLVVNIQLEKNSFGHRKNWAVHFWAVTHNIEDWGLQYADNMYVGDEKNFLQWNGYKPLEELPFDHLLARNFFRKLFSNEESERAICQ